MKKLIMVILALAVGCSYIPIARAGENASLGLHVTFDLDKPMTMHLEPEGPYEVKEVIETLVVNVHAQDPEASSVNVRATNIPEHAGVTGAVHQIAPYNWDIATLKWTPEYGQAQTTLYPVHFIAESYDRENNLLETAELDIEIRVLPGEPRVISIELTQVAGALAGIKPGDIWDLVTNTVTNIGNVPVSVSIKYGKTRTISIDAMDPTTQNIKPGMKPEKDIFSTLVNGKILPPPDVPYGEIPWPVGEIGITTDDGLLPGESIPLEMTFCAPTSLSHQIMGLQTNYHLRAYWPIKKSKIIIY